MEFNKELEIRKFNNSQIKKLDNDIKSNITRNTFIYNLDKCISKLINAGFTYEEGLKIITNKYNIIYSNMNFKDSVNFFKENKIINNKEELIRCSFLLTFSKENIKEKINNFISKGFSKDDIGKMSSNFKKIFTYTTLNINEHYNLLLNAGISENKLKKLFIDNSIRVMKAPTEKLRSRIADIKSMGFSDDEFNILINKTINIIFLSKTDINLSYKILKWIGLNKVNIKEFIIKNPAALNINEYVFNDNVKYLVSKGLTSNQIKLIFLKAPNILSYNYNKFNYIYKAFYIYNYSDEEINRIIEKNPKIIYHDGNKIIDVIKLFKKYDISDLLIKNITTSYPQIFEGNIKTLENKIQLLLKLDIFDIFVINPKNLIQGIDKTYARYMYIFNNLNEEITIRNIKKLVYTNSKDIPDMDELYKLYNYEDDSKNDLYMRLKNDKKTDKKVICKH